MSGHSVHLGLKLARCDWRPALRCYQLRFAQIIFDFLFELRLRHDGVDGRFGLWIVFRPDAVTPINFLNGSLIGYALRKCQSSSGKLCKRQVRLSARSCQSCEQQHCQWPTAVDSPTISKKRWHLTTIRPNLPGAARPNNPNFLMAT